MTAFWRSIIGFIVMALASGAHAADWRDIRDATIYFRVDESMIETPVDLSWRPAWIANTQNERLYFYAPDGTLLTRIEIAKARTSGATRLQFSAGAGDYRLVIPGKSYRYYRVKVDNAVSSVIEPVKLHAFKRARAGETFYARASETNPSSLHFKSREAANSVSFIPCVQSNKRCANDQLITLENHRDHGDYNTHEAYELQSKTSDAIYKIRVKRTGKIALWIDGGENIFSQKPNDWFKPRWAPGVARLTVNKSDRIATPRIGVYFEFFKPKDDQLALAAKLSPKFSNFYAPEDVLIRNIDRDLLFIEAYQSIGVKNFLTILNDTRRDSISASPDDSVRFFSDYLKRRIETNTGPEVIAFVDEPNLRYRSFEQYNAYFKKHLSKLRGNGEGTYAQIEIAAPESSGMLNGPSKRTLGDHSGIAWTRRLLNDHWNDIDVISWHQWNIRDLEATDIFGETIGAVSALNRELALMNQDAPKKLAISQTNISSGAEISPYEQDTIYAGIWWTAALAEVIGAGGVDFINWFKSVDEGVYRKGVMRCTDAGCRLKPVGVIMSRIHKAIGSYSHPVKSSAHEVRVFATSDQDSENVSFFTVNTSRRRYSVKFNESPTVCILSVQGFSDKDEDGVVEETEIEAPRGQFILPPLSIAIIDAVPNRCERR